VAATRRDRQDAKIGTAHRVFDEASSRVECVF
jgi:hypothetical protein